MVASAHTTAYDYAVRGGSSAGRAPGLQPGGRGFESHPLHSRSDSMSPADWLRFLTELADRADELARSEEHTSELQSRLHLVCRLLLEKKKNRTSASATHSTPSARV